MWHFVKTYPNTPWDINPLNSKLNPICHLLALLGAHHILHVSRIRVNRTVRRGSCAVWLTSSFHFKKSSKFRQNFMSQINEPTRCNSFTSLLLDVYVWLNMFLAPPCPSSGAYNCISSLWFLPLACGGIDGCGLAGYDLPDHDQQCCYRHTPMVKPEAANAVVSSWWWAWRCPKHVEPHIDVK